VKDEIKRKIFAIKMQNRLVLYRKGKSKIFKEEKKLKKHTNGTHKEGVKGHQTNQIYKSVYFKSEYVLTHSEALYIPCTCTKTIV